jgi:hypothetical protein
VSRLSKGKLFFGILAVAVAVPALSDAASISTVYDMNRMLNEPHPMANEYGTRWAPPPTPGYGAPPQALPPASPALIPPASTLPLAPPPSLPPYIPTPVLVPVPASAEPAPPPAADLKPAVSTVTPLPYPPEPETAPVPQGSVDMPVLEISPRLSIGTGGLDVDVVKTAPPPPPPVLPDPGK